MTTLALPMNPLSVLFPAAPGESDEQPEPVVVLAEFSLRIETPVPRSGREGIRDRYTAGALTFEQAVERLHRFGMSWTAAGEYLIASEERA